MSLINKHKPEDDVATPPANYTTLFLDENGALKTKDENGDVTSYTPAGDASGITYAPDNSLIWTDSVDPGNVAEALDDLAVRLNVVENDTAVPPDASEVTFTPQNSINWTDSEDPGNVDDALDDLAARVQGLEENPGGGASTLDDLLDVDASSPNDGDVLTYDSGSGDWVASAATGGGGLVLLEQHTASASASLNFTSCISSTYDEYMVELVNVRPATDNVTMMMRVSTNGGSSYISAASSYDWAYRFIYSAGTTGSSGTLNDTEIEVGGAVANTIAGVSGTIKLFDPLNASTHTNGIFESCYYHATLSTSIRLDGLYRYLATTPVNAFQFLMSSGNIASGTIRVYGISKS